MNHPRSRAISRLWSLLGTLTLVVVLAACGSSGNNTGTGNGAKGPQNPLIACPKTTNTTAASPESGNVTLTVAGWTSSPAEDKLVTDALAAFHQQNPNITTNWTPIPGDYATK